MTRGIALVAALLFVASLCVLSYLFHEVRNQPVVKQLAAGQEERNSSIHMSLGNLFRAGTYLDAVGSNPRGSFIADLRRGFYTSVGVPQPSRLGTHATRGLLPASQVHRGTATSPTAALVNARLEVKGLTRRWNQTPWSVVGSTLLRVDLQCKGQTVLFRRGLVMLIGFE